MKPKLSVKAQARDLVHKAYRARGHRANNLWLVYSPKTDRDLLLSTDLQYLYWLYQLEANIDVIGFELFSINDQGSPDFLVRFHNGESEYHYVRSSVREDAPSMFSSEGIELACRYFDEQHISSNSKEALRWSKPLAFAAGVRGRKLYNLTNSLAFYMSRKQNGRIHELIDSFSEFEVSEVLGVYVRHVSRGTVSMSLADAAFGINTLWEVRQLEQG